jgi:serine/threonine-protein kinase HipA
MATSLWGKVYFRDLFAGLLQQEPGGRCVFTYDPSYLAREQPEAIAHTLPLREQPYTSEHGLHSFFDNLVAEGWFRNVQARALGVNPDDRFTLLLGFGRDLAGAVSVIDPEPQDGLRIDQGDPDAIAALASRASLSGIQRKLLVVKDEGGYRPAGPNELSTHIAKLGSSQLRDVVELEFLTTAAARVLLAGDPIVDMEIATVRKTSGPALVIPRFDRTPTGRKIHFEEFNQLLGRRSGDDKYEGAYEDMGRFIRETPGCLPAEADRLYRQILVCLLLGNTDAHFKNFAMFHTRDGLRLTPAYDLVAAAVYPEYQTIALSVTGARDMNLGALQAKHLVALGNGFGSNEGAILAAVQDINKRLPETQETIERSDVGDKKLRTDLVSRMEKRWRGSFASIGQLLSKRQNKGGRRRTLRSNG